MALEPDLPPRAPIDLVNIWQSAWVLRLTAVAGKSAQRQDNTASGEMIELIPFEESHFDLLIEWSPTSEFLLQWAGPGLSFPLDVGQLKSLLDSAHISLPGSYLFTARQLSDGALIGHGELGCVDRRNRSAKLMRVLVGPSEARGRGLGERIVRHLVRVGFEELGLHRLDLNVYDFNQAAIHCYQRVGFQLEGTLRESCRNNDGYWNTCIMALLRSEWGAL
jgi:RimJ/RimL family protein N-acetyltransferase